MTCAPNCTPEVLDLAFKKAEQYVDNEIVKRVPKFKKFWADLFPMKPIEDGMGLKFDKVRFHLDPGPFYDGFDGWRPLEMSRPENSLQGAHDACGFLPEKVSHGIETLSYSLMQRDLATDKICLSDIRTFWKYKEMQNAIYSNLSQITANIKEQLARNAAMSFAVKHIAIPGIPFNHVDPYKLPNINGAAVGRLNFRVLKRVYDLAIDELAEYAVGTSDGLPLLGLIASPDTIDELFFEDPDIVQTRQAMAGGNGDNSLLTSYGFNSTIRGMFVPMKDWHAPRFRADGNGNLIRVFPRERNVPIEIGSRSVTNPDYVKAEYELLIVFTKGIANIRTRRALTSVGGASNFGPEPQGLLGQWKWSNIESEQNPMKRVGRYITTMEAGVEPGDAPFVVGLLVKRRPESLDIRYHGNPECPPTGSCPSNVLPAQDCPCPMITNVFPTTTANTLMFVFDRAITQVAEDAISLVLSNGTTVVGEVASVSADGKSANITFTVEVSAIPGLFVSVLCGSLVYACTSGAVKFGAGALADSITIELKKGIRCQTAGDDVKVFFGDGTSALVDVSSIDLPKLEWTLIGITGSALEDVDLNAYACEHGGVVKVCCATAAGCPSCDGEVEACEEE
jgi:hypothetical protein